jgi:hypothetical protein
MNRGRSISRILAKRPEQFLKDNPSFEHRIETPPEPELRSAAERLWALLLRAKIEHRFGI